MTTAKSADERLSASGGSKLTDALALASVAAVVLLLKLGAGSLAAWDEAIYAEVSKEMARGGDWLTPHWAHQPWFEKPPLLVWTTAVFFKLFGVSEFWARAASSLSGVALVVVTYLVARLAYERRVGLLAAAVLLTSYHFLSFARFGTMDVMLALFTTLAVYGYLRVRRGGEGDGRWWYLVWLAVALALMLKGAGGLIAPAVVALALVFDRRLGAALGSRHFWSGCLLALLIVAPWHALMLARYGPAFAHEYVGYHVVARLTRPLEGHPTGYLYYLARLIDGFFPWCLIAPFAVVSGVRENVKGESRSRVFLIVAALVFVVFTLIPTRRPWYVVPMYPALAIIIAAFVVRVYRARQSRPLQRRVVVAACALLLVVGGAYSALSLYLNHDSDAPLAKLSRLAAGASGDEPLVLFSESEPFYAQTALFYSDRPVRQAYAASKPPGADAKRYVDYERLEEVLGGETRRIILSRGDATRLSASYDIKVIAEADPLVYASIKRKG